MTTANATAVAIAANTAPPPPNNADAMRQAYYDRCREWGEKAGAGDTSKVGWIMDTTRSAWDPNSPVGKPSGTTSAEIEVELTNEATVAYEAYRGGREQKAGEMGKRLKGDEDSRANRISEVKKYLKLGAMPLIKDNDMGGYGTLKRAQKMILERDDVKGEVEDLLSKVATQQLRTQATPLPDDRIIEILTEHKVKGAETYADAMGRVRTQLDAIWDKFNDRVNDGHANDHKTARAIAQKIIDDEGGTQAEIRKREAAALKEANAKKKAKGKKKK